jgi:hypothetical protein
MTEVSVESAQKVDVKKMTKTERQELRRIIARRFKVLRDQLHRRERELEYALREQIRQENETAIAKMEKKVAALVTKQNKIAAEWVKLDEEAVATGLNISQIPAVRDVNLATLKARGYKIVDAGDRKEIDRRVKEIKEASGWYSVNLRELEWRLDEQLAVGELETEDSKEFLEALPTIDTLLPLPVGIEIPEIEDPSWHDA